MSRSQGGVLLKALGVIRSPYRSREEAPKQGIERDEVSTLLFYDRKKVESLAGSKRLRLLYWMHLANRKVLWSEKRNRGIFATRSPERPNPLGVAVVEVVSTRGREVQVRHLDAVDGTPLVEAFPL